ncbi:MAG: glutathione synthase [Gammaproteobacteria bacterium]|nr:glutathione synthase [Gammaproteobacteria bacterium]NKB63572.1 glutathione synthase [Gammaproteobacteria bacterium]
MKHAFIMDPIESVKPWKDTTYFLMLACRERGHEVCYLDQQSLSLVHDQLWGNVVWLDVLDNNEKPFTALKKEFIPLGKTDAVWLRTDPPFNRRYFYTTLLLDFLPDHTQIINRPSGVRNWNEKLAALLFPQFTPKTVVTNDVEDIKRFAREQGRVTIKPVDGFGGKGIIFYRPGDDEQGLNLVTHNGSHWVIVQEYLEEAKNGDKRILILNGNPLGAILRMHAEGVELNNLDAGGSAHPVELTEKDLEICESMRQPLIDEGIIFAGIDVIGDKLIEVNVTSPTGLQELSQFTNSGFHHEIIQALE